MAGVKVCPASLVCWSSIAWTKGIIYLNFQKAFDQITCPRLQKPPYTATGLQEMTFN